MDITIPYSPLFYTIGAISKESIRRSDAQLVAKWPRVELTLDQQDETDFLAAADVAYATSLLYLLHPLLLE